MIQSRSTKKRTVQMRVLSDDQIWEIKQAAFEIIEKVGFKCLHASARKMLAGAGAIIEENFVRIPRYIVEGCLSTTPQGWTIYDREGNRAMEVEGRKSHYGTSTASPNTKDALTGEYHDTRVEDIGLGAKVADACENIDFVMPFGSSLDVPGNTADVHEFPVVAANTTKPMVFIGYSGLGFEYVFEMAAVVAGDKDRLRRYPFVIAYPEAIAPLVFPEDVVDRIFVAADRFMPQLPGATVQAGATGPVTLAGMIAQLTAEALVHICIAQLRQPGCPVGMSGNVGILDMNTALVALGAPENSLALAAQAEVAQSFNLPTWGLAGVTDSKLLDAQAGIESTFGIICQGLAGLNLIHDVGYLASGMACSCEQLVMGNEIVGMAKRFIEGITVNSETIARDVIAAVGPGKHFMEHEHTFDHFREEIWISKMLDRRPIQAWHDAGKPTMESRVQEKVREIIETHQPKPLEDRIIAELDRLKKEGEKEILKKYARS